MASTFSVSQIERSIHTVKTLLSHIHAFTLDTMPLEHTNSVTIQSHRTPSSWFNPTHLGLRSSSSSSSAGEWQSRRHRKARYSPKPHHVHPASRPTSKGAEEAEKAEHALERTVYLRVQRVEDELKPHLILDVSFWIAFIFTFGSVVWVVNGVYC
jgi:hypothetical protein